MEQSKPDRLLEPLPVPEWPWESISMDSILSLPKMGEYGSILVVVNRFSKYVFIPAPLHCSMESAQLFLKHVNNQGIPQNITSDKDSRFLGQFWTGLFKLLGSKQYFSTSLHPQTNGQAEGINALLEQYWWHLTSANKGLDETTRKSPILLQPIVKLCIRQKPLQDHHWTSTLHSAYKGCEVHRELFVCIPSGQGVAP